MVYLPARMESLEGKDLVCLVHCGVFCHYNRAWHVVGTQSIHVMNK